MSTSSVTLHPPVLPTRKKGSMGLGRLILRVTVGAIFVEHGTQKLLGWFGGAGPDGPGTVFESMGLRDPGALAPSWPAPARWGAGCCWPRGWRLLPRRPLCWG